MLRPQTGPLAETEADLRAKLRDAMEQVHGHPHWDTLNGPDLVKARMRLKHVDDPAEG